MTDHQPPLPYPSGFFFKSDTAHHYPVAEGRSRRLAHMTEHCRERERARKERNRGRDRSLHITDRGRRRKRGGEWKREISTPHTEKWRVRERSLYSSEEQRWGSLGSSSPTQWLPRLHWTPSSNPEKPFGSDVVVLLFILGSVSVCGVGEEGVGRIGDWKMLSWWALNVFPWRLYSSFLVNPPLSFPRSGPDELT